MLTERQKTIILSLAAGRTLAEIAEKVNLSYYTIRHDSCVIKDILEARNQRDMLFLAIERGYIKPEQYVEACQAFAKNKPLLGRLQPRQVEVIMYSGLGVKSKDMKEILGISTATASNHLRLAYLTLQVSNMREALSLLIGHKVVTINELLAIWNKIRGDMTYEPLAC